MNNPESEEDIAAHIARKKIASASLKNANRLIGKFEANDRANRRTAIIGLSTLLLILGILGLSNNLFEQPPEPDSVLVGKILQLKADGAVDDPGKKAYSAQVELGSGETIWADVDSEIFDRFEPGHTVEIACFNDPDGTRHEVFIGKLSNFSQ